MEITADLHREEKHLVLHKKENIKLTKVLEHRKAKSVFEKQLLWEMHILGIDNTLLSFHVCIIEQGQETIC